MYQPKRIVNEIIKNQNNNKSEYIIILIANINKKTATTIKTKTEEL